MTTKEYLLQVRKLEYKISRMKLRSEEYERLSHSISSPKYDSEPVSGTRNLEAPFVKWIMKKCDLDKEIEALEEKIAVLSIQIEEAEKNSRIARQDAEIVLKLITKGVKND